MTESPLSDYRSKSSRAATKSGGVLGLPGRRSASDGLAGAGLAEIWRVGSPPCLGVLGVRELIFGLGCGFLAPGPDAG